MWRLGLAGGLALTLGWLLVQAAWPGRACALVKTSLALGLGLGLTSMGYVVAISLWRPSRAAAVGADVALLLAGSALAWATIRHGPPAAGPLRPWLIAAVGCLGLGAVAIFTLKSLGWPAGDWDAWAIWNLRARFIARGGDHRRDGFSPLLAWSHPDYPLLVPAGVARLWAYTRHETGLAPVALGALFTVATMGLAASAVAVVHGTSQGLVAAVLLLGTPALMLQGAAQDADVPLAFFVLAPLALFCLLDRLPARRAALGRLAGLTLGLAGCVKNEGLLVVAAVLVARLVTLLWIEGGGPGFARSGRSWPAWLRSSWSPRTSGCGSRPRVRSCLP
jgi:Dolichyl-phosphate-mannose-protein mannosyltransferase